MLLLPTLLLKQNTAYVITADALGDEKKRIDAIPMLSSIVPSAHLNLRRMYLQWACEAEWLTCTGQQDRCMPRR